MFQSMTDQRQVMFCRRWPRLVALPRSEAYPSVKRIFVFLQAAADAYGELEDLRDELRAAQAAKAVGKQQAAELARLKREQGRATAELQKRLDAAAVSDHVAPLGAGTRRTPARSWREFTQCSLRWGPTDHEALCARGVDGLRMGLSHARSRCQLSLNLPDILPL